ncbi:hypothetical protein WBK31_24225 [Nonomuraea sp. N2-4H]
MPRPRLVGRARGQPLSAITTKWAGVPRTSRTFDTLAFQTCAA